VERSLSAPLVIEAGRGRHDWLSTALRVIERADIGRALVVLDGILGENEWGIPEMKRFDELG
jgi:hypothetical protein